MDVEDDFSDFEASLSEFEWEVQKSMIDVGHEAVEYAIKNGNYKDRTGRLRASNTFDVDEDSLTLENKADYASYVESKGFDVISGAALFAEQELKKKFSEQ